MSARHVLVVSALRASAFLSGGAALVFETLWFRQVGLLLGNAVWSSTIVLASFMGGLAIGNAVAGRFGGRLRRPLRTYAALELLVGLGGAALVITLPLLTPLLVPLLRASLVSAASLNGVRALAAFLLLLIPASAMGATLPLQVQALAHTHQRLGWTLGQLYGWNTLGAVLGTLAGDAVFIAHFGVRGAAFLALALNVAAAAVALGVDRVGPPSEVAAIRAPARPSLVSWTLLAASFLAGGVLLALEVVWFRFLLLHVAGTSLTFSAMLAVVLVGIAGGGLAASAWVRRRPAARRALPLLALLAGIATVLSYARFQDVLRPLRGEDVVSMMGAFAIGLPLMLPTCFFSGLVFTLVGDAVREQSTDDARATGAVSLANTLGAMSGALLGGFILLPGPGIDASLLGLGLAYAGVAAATWPAARSEGRVVGRRKLAVGAALFALAFLAFPRGLMERRYFPAVVSRWIEVGTAGTEVVATRQGVGETAFLVRSSRWGTPVSHRLLTNSISMSISDYLSSRYMRAFVYLPVALNPRARRALLISYGLGVTAKTLTDTSSLSTIDVVDVSRDIVEVTRRVFPSDQHPLDDPRVRLHIEDGRFFLLTRTDSYDIITGEPPPPATAGMWSLYSKEYFELMRGRLAEGGVVSYWLPVHQMQQRDAKAVVAAFCAAFPDCSVWSGSGAEWILLGTRHASPVTEADFERQWRDPRVRRTLSALAYERPEHLGATFLADASTLAEWTGGVQALDDDHPHRITPRVTAVPIGAYFRFADPGAARERFARSAFVRRLWPAALRERTVAAFVEQSPVLRIGWRPYGVVATDVRDLAEVLTRSSQRTAVLWLMGGVDALTEQAARDAFARGTEDRAMDEVLAVSAMADRDYRRAEVLFARALQGAELRERLVKWRVLALCLAGERAAAAEAARELAGAMRIEDRAGWTWLLRTYDLPDVFARLRLPRGGRPSE